VSSGLDLVELVIASGKGGVGKSLLASSLAILLAKHGHRLVAVDADAEAPNLHLALGVREWDRVEPYYEGRIAYIDRAWNIIIIGYVSKIINIPLSSVFYDLSTILPI